PRFDAPATRDGDPDQLLWPDVGIGSATTFPKRRAICVTSQNTTQIATATIISPARGEKISTNPFPFTSAAKLETQNGVMNKRSAGHVSNSTRRDPERVVLISSAAPMITLNPTDVSHSRGLASKYRTSTTSHQMKYHHSTSRPPESPAR